jgi:hypothetical protein
MELIQGRRTEARHDPSNVHGVCRPDQAIASTSQGRVGGFVGWLFALIHQRQVNAERRSLKVIEMLTLGGRRQVALVSCEGERYLVGMGHDSVETIVRVGDTSMKVPEASCLGA